MPALCFACKNTKRSGFTEALWKALLYSLESQSKSATFGYGAYTKLLDLSAKRPSYEGSEGLLCSMGSRIK